MISGEMSVYTQNISEVLMSRKIGNIAEQFMLNLCNMNSHTFKDYLPTLRAHHWEKETTSNRDFEWVPFHQHSSLTVSVTMPYPFVETVAAQFTYSLKGVFFACESRWYYEYHHTKALERHSIQIAWSLACI